VYINPQLTYSTAMATVLSEVQGPFPSSVVIRRI